MYLKDYLNGTVTEKEVIMYVRDKMVEQGRRSVDHVGTCRYRGQDGTQCGIGSLLTDDECASGIEGYSLSTNLGVHEFSKRLGIKMTAHQLDFLSDIQNKMHDNLVGVTHPGMSVADYFRERVRNAAERLLTIY